MRIDRNITEMNFTRGGEGRSIGYIVIHYTGNDGDTARSNTEFFKRIYRGASAHYFIDESSVWQCVEDGNIAWHCGTSGVYVHNRCRNSNSIGIELCSRRDSEGRYYFARGTVENAAELIKALMEKYKIPARNILRHYDITGKICPEPYVRDKAAWQGFVEALKGREDETENKARGLGSEGKEGE